MNAAGSNFWQTGVWLIPLILLAIIGGLYLVSRLFEDKSHKELKNLRAEMRRLQSSRKELAYFTRAYSVDDPEPYGSLVERLMEHLELIEKQSNRLEQRLVRLQEGAHALTSNRWRTTMGAPFLWPPLLRGISQVQNELQAAWGTLDRAGEFEGALSGVSWQVAQQAGQAQRLCERIIQLLEELRARNLQGEVIEAAIRQAQDSKTALDGIPQHFLADDKASVLEQAEVDSTAQVHEILAETLPALEKLWEQAQDWERRHGLAIEWVATMRQALEEASRTLDNLPHNLEVVSFKNQFEGLEIVAQNLESAASRLEVDNLDSVAQEAERIAQIAQEAGAQLKRARRELAALESVLGELSQGFEQLPLQLATLRAKSVYPVEWTESFDLLSNLNRQLGELGSRRQTRTPEAVQKDLEIASRLRADLKDLTQQYEQVQAAHTRLVGLMDSLEFKQMCAWLPQAQEIVAQAGLYGPENWPGKSSVTGLANGVEILAKDVQRLMPSERSASIPETEIVQRLDEALNLSQTYRELKKTAEDFQARLAGIQDSEKQAQQNLETARNTLNQVVFIIHTNDLLSEVAASEASRLQDEVQARLEELGQRENGSVDKKCKRAGELIARFEQSANRWLDRLNQDILAAMEDLSAILSGLDSIVLLDETTVAQARRMLSDSGESSASRYRGKSNFPQAELVQEFKARSDYWQTCAANLHALKDVEDPVFESYEQAYNARQQTLELLADATTQLRQLRGWPPTSISFDSQQHELSQIDVEWRALKEKPARAISLVQQLGSLSSRYQALGGKINQNIERASRETDEIIRLEGQIEEVARDWQQRIYDLGDSPQASQEIGDLLASVDRELDRIQRQAKKGAKDYDQILHDLNELYRRARYFKAEIDENRSIDISGRVSTRR
jgi:uncharacterized phage infection (PIP) family protein YhgE